MKTRAGLTFPRSRHLTAALVAVVLAASYPGVSANAAQLSPQEVSQFMANPTAALQNNPQGGDKLTSFIRDLVQSDPSTLSTIISLLSNANADQQASIGSGLGQAAAAIVQTNPDLASQIQQALAATGVQVAIASFALATGTTTTAATGGGGGGGGVGGPTNSSTPFGGSAGGNTGGTTSTATPNGSGGVLTGSSGSFTSGSGSTTGSTTGSTVSPR